MLSPHPTEPNDQLTFTYDDRHWRVRGLEKQLSCERLKVNLLVTRRELVHVDTLDLYASRLRRTFLKEAAAELYVDEALLKQDLGRLLLELELRQDTLMRDRLAPHADEVPVLSAAEHSAALELLQDPHLVDRILADYEACGLVGEETNKLVCYLACVSRLLPQPLSVLIQSSSAAGKTTLQDAVLRFMPREQQVRLSTLTAQSLYYLGRGELTHKILAVAEEEGVAEATYALKLLQSEGRLSLACVQRDRDTGRPQTRLYEVEGPVALLLTTTAETPHPELVNRCLTLAANEQAEQTAAIHQRQRARYLPEGHDRDAEAITLRQQHAQRLLEPCGVVIPWADKLTFRTDQPRYRRDHAKYLTLIVASALLHQYQRQQVSRSLAGGPQRCVVATLDDLELANRLAPALLGESLNALLPHTRRLLAAVSHYVAHRAEHEGVTPGAVRFTQRELREAIQWSDRWLRTHLARLVELEYVSVQRSGRGNQRVYQLGRAAAASAAAPIARLHLAAAEQVRGQFPRGRQ